MKQYGKVLIVDPNKDALIGLQLLLKDYFVGIDCERNPNLIPSYLSREKYDIFILEMNFNSGHLNGNEGFFWMNRIFESEPEAIVILTTANGGIETAVRAIKEGAADFIEKPITNEKITAVVLTALKQRRPDLITPFRKATDRRKPKEIDIIGVSDALRKLLSQVSKVAGTDANVLITGENGTGKELIARAIHFQSKRAAEVFVKVDIGSISSSLFESELFGHNKGSFTDAQADRPGRFETAEKGSLFLDEIGNIPLGLQSKILSVLQNRQLYRIGSNTPVPVNIRLITATNMPLERMVREGKFREDLLYRLNTIVINVPPLRERKADIRVLFYHFKEKFSEKYGKPGLKVNPRVIETLEAWHWPGNVRELEHAVEKAVIMCESDMITPTDFTLSKIQHGSASGEPDCFNLAQNEMRIIHQAIERCSGNLSQASRILGITRKTLYNKIGKYGI